MEDDSYAPDVMSTGGLALDQLAHLPDYVDDNEEVSGGESGTVSGRGRPFDVIGPGTLQQDSAGMEMEDDEDSQGTSEHFRDKKEGHEHHMRNEATCSLTTKAREYIAKNKGVGVGGTVQHQQISGQTGSQSDAEKRKCDGKPPSLPAPLPVISPDPQMGNETREFPQQYFTIRAARIRNKNQTTFGDNFGFNRGGGTMGMTRGLGSRVMHAALLWQTTTELT